MFENLFDINWMLTLRHLALPNGYNREGKGPRIGLRTFALVAVVSCGFMLVGIAVVESADGQARIMQGIITGIGGGAIGVAVAYHHLEIAIALSALNFLTLRFMSPLMQTIGTEDDGTPSDIAPSSSHSSPRN